MGPSWFLPERICSVQRHLALNGVLPSAFTGKSPLNCNKMQQPNKWKAGWRFNFPSHDWNIRAESDSTIRLFYIGLKETAEEK